MRVSIALCLDFSRARLKVLRGQERSVRMLRLARAGAALRVWGSASSWHRIPAKSCSSAARETQAQHGDVTLDQGEENEGPVEREDEAFVSEPASQPRNAMLTSGGARKFKDVDFMLYALVQAYPRAIPYRRMLHALVKGGFIPNRDYKQARHFIWAAHKHFGNVNLPDAKHKGWHDFKELTRRNSKSLRAFPIELSDKGYVMYLERTLSIPAPDEARRELEQILSIPDLPRANFILRPVRKAIGEELFAEKYQYALPEQVPEKYLAAVRHEQLSETDCLSLDESTHDKGKTDETSRESNGTSAEKRQDDPSESAAGQEADKGSPEKLVSAYHEWCRKASNERKKRGKYKVDWN
ncbi:hypothetical protein FVE85_1831 [Porphyridium purpureum]|uniref:Uncharacterized protein n=1 Tax=Porphyridium purpureum TaxID=35688 RepID=A0A5J4YWG5_PORPP|nr:hypothetical protein FVE85_1831 [Porphyridium purpureum]|eukprot:POR5887..scf209_3